MKRIKERIVNMLGKEGVMICGGFIFILTILATVFLSMKACEGQLLPETPQHVNECGEPVYHRVSRVTAYSPTDSTPLITATNKGVRFGIVAISGDLKGKFPMNSSLAFWIDGKKYVVQVEDRMNKRHKNSMDIFFWKRGDAKKFGVVRNILVWKVEEEAE